MPGFCFRIEVEPRRCTTQAILQAKMQQRVTLAYVAGDGGGFFSPRHCA